ncbi:MAG: metal ABC transporter ATP-binding protein [Synechococcales cyanobacterium]
MAILEVNGLSVRYGSRPVLSGVSARFQSGQLTGVIGANGAGKSTLLKAMLGLVVPTAGEILYNGAPLRREQVAYVPQRQQVDWSYPATVLDVVLMGRVRATGWVRRFDRHSHDLARAALARVDMDAFVHRPIGELSGGQQQRVFLARALAQETDVILLDEPLAGIDLKTQGFIFQILQDLCTEDKLVALVHHDLGAVLRHCHHLILLQQRLVAAGSPHQVLRPEWLQQAYGEGLLLEVA